LKACMSLQIRALASLESLVLRRSMPLKGRSHL
jgi:hypothetical protein